MKGWVIALVVAGVALGAYLFLRTTEEPLEAALQQGHVTVTVSSENETSATFSFLPGLDMPRRLLVVVPAGTIIRNHDAGGQWVITAKDVTVRVGAEPSATTAQVPTYCLHQFDTPPLSTSLLTVDYSGSDGAGPGSGDAGAVRDVTTCLAAQATSDRHQAAVWMISDRLIDLSYSDAEEWLRRHYRAQYDARDPDERVREIKTEIRRRFAKANGGDLDASVDRFFARDPGKAVAFHIDTVVYRRLTLAVSARAVLEACIPDVAQRRFFATSPTTS